MSNQPLIDDDFAHLSGPLTPPAVTENPAFGQGEAQDAFTVGANTLADAGARAGASDLGHDGKTAGDVAATEARLASASAAVSGRLTQLTHAEDDLPEITWRGMIVATLVGGIVGAQNIYFSWKLGWTMGVSLTSSILGFALLSTMMKSAVLHSVGFISKSLSVPFGVKENCCMQTAASAAASMSSASGLAVGLFALTPELQQDFFGDNYDPSRTYVMSWQEQILWCYGILMLGFFVAIPLRKPLIEDYQLVFPSGTATAYVMTAVHESSGGSAEGVRQFKLLLKTFLPCSLWYAIKSFLFVGLGTIPIFGMKAFSYDWYFDGSTAFYATGIMIPPKFSLSWFSGSLVGWAFLVPLLNAAPYRCAPTVTPETIGDEDCWYLDTEEMKGIKGPFGYVLFPSIAIMLVDSMFELGKLSWKVVVDYRDQAKRPASGMSRGGRSSFVSHGGGAESVAPSGSGASADARVGVSGSITAPAATASAGAAGAGPRKEPRRDKDVPAFVWVSGIMLFCATGVLAGSQIFPQTKWYSLFVASVLGPLAAPGILYGVGMTDIGMQTVFAKLAQILLCLWEPGSYTAPLVGGCLVFTCLSQAGDLIQDFKTGYLVGATPNAMLTAQIIGAMSAPWWAVGAYAVYMAGSDVPSTDLPALAAKVWLGFVETFQEGTDAMPKHAIWFVVVATLVTATVKTLEIVLPKDKVAYLPSLMPFSIGFYSFPNYGLNAVIGAAIRHIWLRRDKEHFEKNYAVVAAGMVAGEGITSLIITMIKAFSGSSGWLRATWSNY